MHERFKSRSVTPDQADAMEAVRETGALLAEVIVEQCPAGPEREQAVTWIQAAVLLANNAISRRR